MGSISLSHWILVFFVVVILFGTKRLKDIGKDLGAALQAFREGLKEGESPNTSTVGSSKHSLPSVDENSSQTKIK